MSLLAAWNPTCCTLPAVQSSYQPEGKQETIFGWDTYTTGPPPTPGQAVIVCVFDIFGFWPQSKQGADLLAKATGLRVIMPDFFHNNPLPIDIVPFNTPEKVQARDAFFSGRGSFDARADDLKKLVQHLKDQGAGSVGAYGLCWGGKVIIQASGAGTPLSAAASVHPAMLTLSDFEKATIPVGLYPSKDEPADESAKVEAYISKSALANQSDYKRYPENHHGFAGARANLDDPSNFKSFGDVYARLSAFFSANLKQAKI